MFRFFERIGRYFIVLKVLANYGIKFLRHKIFGGRKPFISPYELRGILEELGGSFLKFGQLAAVRPDYFPKPYCLELLKLLDEVPPIKPGLIDEIFIKEFGKTPEKIFANFNRNPVSAASFGQVHEAFLASGERAAVKIQRPFVAEDFSLDARFFSFLAWVLRQTGIVKIIDPVRVVQEFIRWTERELDYRKEAEHSSRLSEQARRNGFLIKIPKVFREYSTKRILTMEFIEGETLKSYYLKREAPPEAYKIFKEGIFFELHSFLLDGFFHADPHPANLLVRSEGGLAFVDAGISSEVKIRDRKRFAKFIKAVTSSDLERALDAFFDIVETPFLEMLEEVRFSHPQYWMRFQFMKNVFMAKIRKELEEVIKLWHEASDKKGSAAEKSALSKMLKLFHLAEENSITVPQSVILFMRTFFSIDIAAFELVPDLNVIRVVREFFEIHREKLENLERLPDEPALYLDPRFGGEWPEIFRTQAAEAKSLERDFLREKASAIMETFE